MYVCGCARLIQAHLASHMCSMITNRISNQLSKNSATLHTPMEQNNSSLNAQNCNEMEKLKESRLCILVFVVQKQRMQKTFNSLSGFYAVYGQ